MSKSRSSFSCLWQNHLMKVLSMLLIRSSIFKYFVSGFFSAFMNKLKFWRSNKKIEHSENLPESIWVKQSLLYCTIVPRRNINLGYNHGQATSLKECKPCLASGSSKNSITIRRSFNTESGSGQVGIRNKPILSNIYALFRKHFLQDFIFFLDNFP